MNDSIIENWNKEIKPNDEVYHLGDFAFKSDYKIDDIMKALNGKIYLLKGNHEQIACKHSWRFEWIKDYFEIKQTDPKIVVFHYPMVSWNWSYHGSIHLFGHVHGNYIGQGKSMDVGVDPNNFKPISLDEILTKFKNIKNEKNTD
jgi:calcineurin-like phosphoesterase family protein